MKSDILSPIMPRLHFGSRPNVCIGAVIALSVILGACTSVIPALPFMIMILGLFLLFLLHDVKFLVLGIIFFRPILDLWRTVHIFGGLDPAQLVGILVIVIGIVATLLSRTPVRAPLLLPFAVFFVSLVASVFVSNNPRTSLSDIARITSSYVFFLIAFNTLGHRNSVKNFLYLIVVSSLIPMIFGLSQLLSSDLLFGGRVYGTFSTPNSFGYFLMIILLVVGALLLQEESRLIYVSLLLVSLLGLGLLLATATRGALIGLILGAGGLFLLSKPRRSVLRFSLTIGLLYVLAALCMFALTAPSKASYLAERYAQVVTIESRLNTWTTGIGLFVKKPFLGIGIGIYNADVGFGMLRHIQRGVHNDYLRLLVETGMIGFLSYLGFLGATYISAIRVWRRTKGLALHMWPSLLISLLASITFAGLSNNILGGTDIQFHIWGIAAVCLYPYCERLPKPSVYSKAEFFLGAREHTRGKPA